MVIVSPAPPTLPSIPAAPSVRTREATIRDADGEALAVIELDELPLRNELFIGEVEDQSWLMTYYFGRGGRDVLLALNDWATHARLETCWAGDHRDWWLELGE